MDALQVKAVNDCRILAGSDRTSSPVCFEARSPKFFSTKAGLVCCATCGSFRLRARGMCVRYDKYSLNTLGVVTHQRCLILIDMATDGLLYPLRTLPSHALYPPLVPDAEQRLLRCAWY